MTGAIFIAITTLQLTNIILVMIFLFVGFKYLETTWSYKISKPYRWERAVKNGEISNRLKKIERLYRDKVRFYAFWLQIERLKRDQVHGAFAEVGVYKGETANIIHTMDPSRELHLFDTFSGFDKKDFPELGTPPANAVDFSDTSVESVRTVLGDSVNVHFHKGYFPDTTISLADQPFAFVHLDADLYNPTLAALNYFYPRLATGGVIMLHDFNHMWDGVGKAMLVFRTSTPITIAELPDWQGSILIVKHG